MVDSTRNTSVGVDMQAKDMTFTDRTHPYTANAGMELKQYSGKSRRGHGASVC